MDIYDYLGNGGGRVGKEERLEEINSFELNKGEPMNVDYGHTYVNQEEKRKCVHQIPLAMSENISVHFRRNSREKSSNMLWTWESPEHLNYKFLLFISQSGIPRLGWFVSVWLEMRTEKTTWRDRGF